MQPNKPKSSRRLPKKYTRKLAIAAVVIVVLLAVVVYRSRNNEPSDAKLIKAVQAVAIIPDETPAIRTIVDISKSSQPFLSQAANGDKILIFSKANKVVVYRPSSKQIVNIGPITATSATVFIRNGTNQDITAASEKIRQLKDFTIISQDKSAKTDYARTLVIDLSGARRADAEALASAVGGDVVDLPRSESRVESDLLLIVGSDQL